MGELVTYERKEGFSIICLNRPEKRNAISLEMAELLLEKLEQAEEDEIKFLVLTGAGDRMFCAGGDLNELHGELTNEEAFQRLCPMMTVLKKIINFPVPVIALLNGDALGGGCELATACDIRIARENTKFGFIQTNIGILPGWGGGAILYKKIQPSFALEWVMGGEILPAEELRNYGWIQNVASEERWDSEQLLERYNKKSLKQMRLLKAQFKTNIQVETLSEQMIEEVKTSSSLWDSEEHRKALEKFSQRKN